METYSDGDIEDEREAAMFPDEWDGWWAPGYPTKLDEMNANEADDYWGDAVTDDEVE